MDLIDGLITMRNIRYELDDREIYNDIRSETGLSGTETVIDSDPAYESKMWSATYALPDPGYTKFSYYTASMPNPESWSLGPITCTDNNGNPYYDYNINLIPTNEDKTKAVELKNTGTSSGWIHYTVKYRYLISEGQTHEETTYNVISVRAADAVSMLRYGPRVMNLVWPEGVTQGRMQTEVNAKLAWYKDPHPRLYITVLGKDMDHREFMLGQEIDGLLAVACPSLGLTATYRIKEIDITGDRSGYPVADMMLSEVRAEESYALFILDASLLDGTDVLA